VTAAFVFADYAIWLVPLGLVIGWLRGNDSLRRGLIEASAAALAALFFAQIVVLLWPHPRPFMIGLGTYLMPHIADPSLPSDHLTFLCAVAASLMLHARTRRAGALLGLLGLPIAWSRIYLGVHFPFDMVGAALVASAAAGLAAATGRWFAEPVLRVATAIYRPVFAPLIRRGWVSR
jgi:undecaprenyl-diphosphatase